MDQYTEKQRQVREQFIKERGKWKWNDTWETILSLNEGTLSAYSNLSSVAHRKGALDAKTKELIYIAMDASVTHMYLPGLRRHMAHAINDLGVTPEEIMETLIITSMVGTASYTEGFPLLMHQLQENGCTRQGSSTTEKQAQLKKRFVEHNGYWGEMPEAVLMQDPEIFEAYLAYLEASESKAALAPKIRELLFVAVNAAPSALNTVEIQRHIARANHFGASREELLEVFEVVCCLGIHTVLEGIPILNEILTQRKQRHEGAE